MKKIVLLVYSFILLFSFISFSQIELPIYFKGAIREKRNIQYRNIVQNTIIKNLSLAINAETEENWLDAFWGMELLKYKSPWADSRINYAFDSIEKRSPGFQRALLELAYTNYPDRFSKQAGSLLKNCTDAKVFAMSVEYLLLNNSNAIAGINFENKRQQLEKSEKDKAIMRQLLYRLKKLPYQGTGNLVAEIIDKNFLQNHTILYSFQRKNRNYPGLTLIRDSTGNFIKDVNGNIFSVPQLARSISNLPGYLTNGNTPQGIFRMHGFDSSHNSYIGPTHNIQLTMPFETSLQHFFNDSTITDTAWTEDWYKKLLTYTLTNYSPLYESFYAGKAGRTEIIAHGTTVDPEFYAHETYFPQTPTMGCLCTIEIWSDVDGKRLISDQQRLVTALQMAGGANGYCVVVEIDDAQKPVTLPEILSILKLVSKK